MKKYILKRLILAVITFFGITIMAYLISSMMPGDPVQYLLTEPEISQEVIDQRRAELGLDDPLPVQYARWLGELLHGNFGTSYRTSHSVTSVLFPALKNTLILTSSSLLLAVILSLILGILSALQEHSAVDRIISFFTFFSHSFPSFFAGMLAIFFLCVKLKVFPLGGMYEDLSARSPVDFLWHLTLPACVLTLAQVGNLTRQVRNNMLEVLRSDYIRTAKSKGIRRGKIIFRHALRNVLIPIITNIGLSIPFLISGSVVCEELFSWPGMGTLLVTSISCRDYPVLMAITVMVAVTVLVMNLLIDLIYYAVDPRIRIAD